MIIANYLNTLIGIGLVYVAVLNLDLLAGKVLPTAVLAVVIFGLSLVSRRRDLERWQSTCNLILACGLMLLAGLQIEPYRYLTFWGLFWVGILVATLALWAAIQGRGETTE